MISRKEMRQLASRLMDGAMGRTDGSMVDVIARDVRAAASVLSTPTWFSAFELHMAADAMDALNTSTADAWTLRKRLDDFVSSGAVINAESFAEFLRLLPNGGQE